MNVLPRVGGNVSSDVYYISVEIAYDQLSSQTSVVDNTSRNRERKK